VYGALASWSVTEAEVERMAESVLDVFIGGTTRTAET